MIRRSQSTRWNKSILRLEELENRVTPAAFFLNQSNIQYVDAAGVVFNITATEPIFTDIATANSMLTFEDPAAPGTILPDFIDNVPFTTTPGTQAFLSKIDLTGVSVSGVSISVVSTTVPTALTVVGTIDTGSDMNKIVVRGRLFGLNTFNSDVQSLTVDFLGTGDITDPTSLVDPLGNPVSITTTSDVQGNVGLLKVLRDVDNGFFRVSGRLNQVVVLGNVGVDQTLAVAGYDVNTDDTSAIAAAEIGTVQVRQNIFGSDALRSGSIYTLPVDGNPGGDITSVIVGGSIVGGHGNQAGAVSAYGSIGRIQVTGSVGGGDIGNYSARIAAGWDTVNTVATALGGNLTSVLIGRNLTGSLGGGVLGSNNSGEIFAHGHIVNVQIKGDLTGGTGADSGRVHADGSLSSITIGGSVTGGLTDDTATNSGEISTEDFLGTVKIGKNLKGGLGIQSGRIFSRTTIGSVTLGGSLLGGGVGSGDDNGQISAVGNIGTVSVKGSQGVQGGLGANSGSILSETGNINNITITAGLSGGQGDGSGNILAVNLPSVKIGKDMSGGDGNNSGVIHATGVISTLNIGGSVRGGTGQHSAEISADGTDGDPDVITTALVTVKVGGDVRGGAGDFSGRIVSGNNNQGEFSSIGSVTIGGSILGNVTGDGNNSAEIVSNTSIGTITVKKNVTGGRGVNSGRIHADTRINTLTIGGSLGGSQFTDPGNGNGIVSAGLKITTAKVTGSIIGGTADISGGIYVGDLNSTDDLLDDDGNDTLGISTLSIGGSVVAGSGDNTGFVFSQGGIYKTTVSKDLDGTGGGKANSFWVAGANSARIAANIEFGTVTVVTPGPTITRTSNGFIKIGGFVKGGNNNDTGEILADANGNADDTDFFGDIVQLTIGKGIIGGSTFGPGLSVNVPQDVTRTGYIQGFNIGTKDLNATIGVDLDALVIGTSGIVSGANFGDTLANSGAIRAVNDISGLVIKGSVSGNINASATTETRVVITAGVNINDGEGGSPFAINITGSISHADIGAGYSPSIADIMRVTDDATIADDAVIGNVNVGGAWNSSNMLASVGAGADGIVGLDGVADSHTAGVGVDDTSVGGTGGTIGIITIGKGVTALTGRSYAIVAADLTAGVTSKVTTAGGPDTHTPGTSDDATPLWNMVTVDEFQDSDQVIPDTSAVLLYSIV